jgi:nucleoside-diphosphate-sugar epimerase
MMFENKLKGLKCRVIALGRDKGKAFKRFSAYWNSPLFRFIAQDINMGLSLEESVHYVVHLASNTHPMLYATDPIGTILTNILGTKNLLEWSNSHNVSRFLYTSSVEIYGENRGDVDFFDESYLGYIDCNTLRAGYPESKRVGEALCQAYRKVEGLEIVIARFSRVYGPTLLDTDSKAIAQFLKNGIDGKNIILKSQGNQIYSYTYLADIAQAVFLLLAKGVDGQAYNVAGYKSDLTLKDLAELVAMNCQTKVVYESASEVERSGYSKATRALLNANKIRSIGYTPQYSMKDGIERTLRIIRDIKS